MSRGVKFLIIGLVVLLVAALGGGGFFVYKLMSKPAAPPVVLSEEEQAKAAEAALEKRMETAEFLNMKEFATELQDQMSMVQLSVSLACDPGKLEEAKKKEPLISRTILYTVRGMTAKQIEGAVGMVNLEKALTHAIFDADKYFKTNCIKVLVTKLTLQQ